MLSAAEVPENPAPAPAAAAVEFDRDVRPIFEASCLRCHGPERPKSHFRLDDRDSALRGGSENTNDIVPGDASKSMLIRYVSRQAPDMEMPPEGKGSPLTPRQTGLLSAWIDQGAKWNTTNQPPPFEFSFSPTFGGFDVQGNNSKFRELEGVNDRFAGGAEDFSVIERISPSEKLSLSGHVVVPNQDIDLKLALDKNDFGFVHAGFEEWRKYYNDEGGLNTNVMPSQFNPGRDLHVDNGRAWIDFGLALPQMPQIVLGYEYQFKSGTKSMLDWGYANGANIYPATKAVDEQTHIVKFDVTHDFDGWHFENNGRVEFYKEKNLSSEPQIFSSTTYSRMRIETSANGDASIVPYGGDVYTVNATAAYALDSKTRCQTSYTFSQADYGQSELGTGLPPGLDFTRHEVLAGLTRQINRRVSGALHYQYSKYSEPVGGVDNFAAHGFFATVIFKWP
jgi:hypothetical protein